VPARKKPSTDAPAETAKGRKKTPTAVTSDAPAKRTRKAAAPKSSGGNGAKQDLVIVESPSKATTIEKYLGSGYRVKASKGHIRDLPKKKKRGEKVAGVDIDSGWKASYEILEERGKKENIDDLAREVKKSGKVYLATDFDREGEAIAWHLSEVLKLPDARTFRITFNEITRQAVTNALAQAGKIDMDRVRAQEARRILDRIVGFPLSGLLNRKVRPKSSAGRVQSVALKLVVDREREIEAFNTQEYWKITALLAPENTVQVEKKPFLVILAKTKKAEETKPSETAEVKGEAAEIEVVSALPAAEKGPKIPPGTFQAELAEWNGKKFELGAEAASSEAAARAVATLLDMAAYQVTNVEQKDRSEKAPPPFITSSLQQQAYLRLHFTSERTMRTAQKLYEGVPLGSEGSIALITYMRTDSTRVSNEALQAVRGHIQASFGEKYLPEKPNFFAAGKGAQEAHEAIRPTDLAYSPQRVASLGLHGDQLKLYTLIYNRFVASQMSPAIFAITNIEISAKPASGEAVGLFKSQGKILKFDGFRRVLAPASKQEDALLPVLTDRQKLDKLNLTASQHFTKPPARYNEASLIDALKKEAIGRPSTYATIISKITDQERGYIDVIDRRFHATQIGKVVTDLLVEYFPRIMDLKFTSHFEEELDEIETGRIKYEAVLNEFWGPFSEALDKAEAEMRTGKDTGEKCPKCGKRLLEKMSRKTGHTFIGCEDYKECKYIKPREGEPERQPPIETEHKCPTCGRPMMQYTGRAGVYLRCQGYPECQTKMNLGPDGKPIVTAQATEYKCSRCGKPMVLREGKTGPFLGCTGYPKCKNTLNVDAEGKPIQPIDLGIQCDRCGSAMVIRKSFRGPFLGCSSYPKCRGTKQLTDELKEKLKDQLPAPAPKKELPKVEISETCPECNGPMRLQLNRRRGNYFLGCAKYPKCKGTRPAPAEVLEQLQEAGAAK
jgi:DNA topoisomerase-1